MAEIQLRLKRELSPELRSKETEERLKLRLVSC